MPALRATFTALRRVRAPWVAVAWLASMLAVYVPWFAVSHSVQGDVWYYWRQLQMLPFFGPAGTLVEYPTPVIAMLEIPQLIVGTDGQRYTYAFLGLMLLAHALFTIVVWKSSRVVSGRRDALPALYWIAFTMLVGTTVGMRFDVIPAILAGSALLSLRWRRPWLAGVLVALGACIKLWPALLILALLGRRENRGRALGGFATTGAVVAVLSLWWGGWDRLLSPLTWQKDRGLQIESIFATVPVLQRAFGVHYPVYISQYQAFEIFGAWRGWLTMASFATALGGVAILALAGWWLLSPGSRDLGAASMLMLFITGIMIVTNKTFSPQYVIWLGGPLAAMLTLPRRDTSLTRGPGAIRFLTGTLVVAALTQLIYPIGYDGLVFLDWRSIPMAIVLALRNLCMLALVGYSAWFVIRSARRRPDVVPSSGATAVAPRADRTGATHRPRPEATAQ